MAQNLVQAYKYFSIAGDNGDDVGQKYRDLIAKRLSPAQIAEARKLANNWLARHRKM